MNRCLVPLLVAAVACATPVSQASTTHVSRCAAADGSSVYTDGSCRAIGAQVVPMSASLLRNLVSEGSIDSASVQPAVARRTQEPGPHGHGRATPDQCARTPAQLAAALRSSLSGGDVNELASIYDWAGMSGRQAKPVLDRLERMSARPLIDGHFFNTGMRSEGSESGVVQLVQGANAAPTVTELTVRQRAGCLFLAF